jgi:Ca2+-binding EF-hand superfamily protein
LPKEGKNVLKQLPKNLKQKIMNLFNLIDTDGSRILDKNEVIHFWSRNFSRINTIELFNQVDINGDGKIQLSEWIEFWTLVYNSNYDEDYIYLMW